MTADTPRTQTGSQTLSRGIRLLEILASAERNLSIDELAAELGVHRSVAYRLLRTLEDHGLVARDSAGRIALGTGLAALASGVARDLQQLALPELTDVANEFGMTCLLAVQVDADEAATLVSAAPRQSMAVVSYRPGHRHPLTHGGPGKAILATLPETAWPDAAGDALRAEITETRERGYAISHDEVVPSLRSVAVPLTLPGQPPASIAVIHVSFPRPEAEMAARLTAAAVAIRRAYGA
ncbi:DNA-binding IclR family transcriptional regulator [Agromyces terreus]|uniref:DNA-binding IclR family transcriptional regulator n=1 Tax=Agromyces terreus TaxID=424795 RepID=A0A9X2GWI9_9MICO|nr:helix-turn-helix domain-containing protein [Agromyces terreus]MCP2370380.1 DNA-binding IclR family transcriptional regulator [Agromyces terreus]